MRWTICGIRFQNLVRVLQGSDGLGTHLAREHPTRMLLIVNIVAVLLIVNMTPVLLIVNMTSMLLIVNMTPVLLIVNTPPLVRMQGPCQPEAC